MSESDEKAEPLSELKVQLDEVIELLNQPNLPIIVREDAEAEGGDAGPAPNQEMPTSAEQK